MINELIKLAKDNTDIAVLWLYGSRAKGTAHAASDYDLAIAFKSFPKEVMERNLRPNILAIEWMHELNLPDKTLSIVDINLVPIPLALEVISHGKVLHVENPLRQIQEELRITSRYELDILPHRERYGT